MSKTLFFDVGNVLVFFDNNKMFSRFSELCSIEPQAVEKTFLQSDLLHEFERGLLDNEMFFREFTQLVGIDIDYSIFVDIVTDIFSPNTSIIPLIEKLKAKGHPLFILSNTNDVHYSHVSQNYPILSQFDGQILSHRVGARKPEAEIYEYAMAYAKAKPSDCFFTDDLHENVAAAKDVGMDSVVFESTEALEQELIQRKIL